jgi:hypothetical protein
MGLQFVFVVLTVMGCGTGAAHSQTLDQQEKCAAQARKTYQEDSYKDRAESQKLGMPEPFSSDYQSHYNTKLNRCLILVTKTSVLAGQTSTSIASISNIATRTANKSAICPLSRVFSRLGTRYLTAAR